MAKAARKKKATANKKSARVTAKPKASAKSAKPAPKKAKKAAKASRPAARKVAPRKIDPLNSKEYRAVTPMLAVSDLRRAMDFYTSAFGFAVKQVMDSPNGPLHAELSLRDSTVMLSPESREQGSLSAKTIGNTPATLYITVEDVDAVFRRAVAAGGQVLMPVMDMFWGDRCCMIGDPDGNKWMIATHVSEPTEAEMIEAMRRQTPAEQPAQKTAAAAAGAQSEY